MTVSKKDEPMNDATLPLNTTSEALLRLLADAMAKLQGKRRPKRGRLHRV